MGAAVGGGGAVTATDLRDAEDFARGIAYHFTRRLPVWMDRDAFTGEALLTVAKCAREFRGGIFKAYVAQRVRWALMQEARRQDPASDWRKRKRLPLRQSDLPPLSFEDVVAGGWDPPAAADVEEDLILSVERRRVCREVRRAVQYLTPRQRQVIEGLLAERDLKEVAALTGTTYQAVWEARGKAFQRLRGLLHGLV